MNAINRVLRNQSRAPSFPNRAARVALPLPDWVEKGTTLVYISKSKGDAHSVRVEKIEDRKQCVVIRFEADHRVWKRVPFAEIKKFGDGTLRPLWKKTEVATVPERPKDFVDVPDESDNEPEADIMVQPVNTGPQLPSNGEEVEDLEVVSEQEDAADAKATGSAGANSRTPREVPEEAAPEAEVPAVTACPVREESPPTRYRTPSRSGSRSRSPSAAPVDYPDASPEARRRAAAAAAAAAIVVSGAALKKKAKKKEETRPATKPKARRRQAGETGGEAHPRTRSPRASPQVRSPRSRSRSRGAGRQPKARRQDPPPRSGSDSDRRGRSGAAERRPKSGNAASRKPRRGGSSERGAERGSQRGSERTERVERRGR